MMAGWFRRLGLSLLLSHALGGYADQFKEMADELCDRTHSCGIHRVAVLVFEPLNDQGVVACRLVQTRLIASLVERKAVSVVERDRLDALKNELNLGMSGYLDESTTRRIGKILGVDGLVLGVLSGRENGFLEINTRLVLVETGEVVGAVTRLLKQNWVEPEETKSSPLPVPSPDKEATLSYLGVMVSTSHAPGTIIFKDTRPLDKKKPALKQIIFIEEDMGSATFEVDYYTPPHRKNKPRKVQFYPSSDFSSRQSTTALQGPIRFRLSVSEKGPFFQPDSSLSFIIQDMDLKSNFSKDGHESFSWDIPFRKIWINPRCQSEEVVFLTSHPSMHIARVDPPTLYWSEGFILYGDFGKASNMEGNYVVIGGGPVRFELKISEWTENRLIIEPPYAQDPRFKTTTINPDLPYYIGVVKWGEASNLHLINFHPQGLPKMGDH